MRRRRLSVTARVLFQHVYAVVVAEKQPDKLATYSFVCTYERRSLEHQWFSVGSLGTRYSFGFKLKKHLPGGHLFTRFYQNFPYYTRLRRLDDHLHFHGFQTENDIAFLY